MNGGLHTTASILLPAMPTHSVSVNDTSVLFPTPGSASSGPQMPNLVSLKAGVEICIAGVMARSEEQMMRNAPKSWRVPLWPKLGEGIYFLPPALGRTISPGPYSQKKATSTWIGSGWLEQDSLQQQGCHEMATWLTSQSLKTHQKYIDKPPVSFFFHHSDFCKITVLSPSPCFIDEEMQAQGG